MMSLKEGNSRRVTVCLVATMLSTPAIGQTTGKKASATPIADSTPAYPAGANGDGTAQGAYNLSRWAENWHGMKDPAKRDDPLDALKFIPLDRAGDSYLTLSGELRLRVQGATNPNLREGDAQRQNRLRVFAGADLHLGDHFRAYDELAHGGLGGVNLGTPNTNLRNDLALQQGFAEVMGSIDGVAVGVRGGRQEFTDGPNLLTSARDDNSLRFVLDGVRGYARGTRVRVDLFDYRYVRYGYEGLGDDETDSNRRVSGVTFGYALPTKLLGRSKLYFDPFVWRLRNRGAVCGGRTAREERMFYGLHLYGDAGPMTLDWTLNHQGGRYDGRSISAWQAFFAQTYRVGKAATAPRVGVHLDYASGGGAYDRGTLRTASGLFGNNIYYSYQLFLTPSNLAVIAPNLTVQPTRKLRVTGEYGFAWRPSDSDAVYRASGAAFASTQRAAGHRVADVARLQAIWSATARLSVTARYEHLMAREALTGAGYASSDFLALWGSFRF
ncbi:alginate export family protein [Sphingomonas sp.]|uniref:alginate export family protein n=1 Tax=Sphingomonas sp. TaxID=28214 RepID=UPI0035C8155F